jgi:hypothetical protein
LFVLARKGRGHEKYSSTAQTDKDVWIDPFPTKILVVSQWGDPSCVHASGWVQSEKNTAQRERILKTDGHGV